VKTLKQDIDDIRRRAFERQALDMAEVEDIDTVGNTRGAGRQFDHSLREIAEAVGLGDSKYPEKYVNDILQRSLKKFIKNYALLLITEGAFNAGMNFDEVCEFAAGICIMNEINGISEVQMLEDWRGDE
jgi:hypothetical protein